MVHCCSVFAGWFEERSRGLGIGWEERVSRYVIKCRIADEDAPPFTVTTDPPRMICLEGQIAIQFCPWCGTKLAAHSAN